MFKCKYVLCEDTAITESGEKVTTYGVSCIRNGATIESVQDIFTGKAEAIHFIQLCNRNKLSEIHLKDAVDDALLV